MTRPLDGLYVLFVDDNADTRDVFRLVLNTAGALVLVAPGAPEAIAMLTTVRPDVIVTDMTMPRMDGYQFLAELRKSAAWQHTPVIAVTGNGAFYSEQDARDAGFIDYLRKPLDPAALTAAIVRVTTRTT